MIPSRSSRKRARPQQNNTGGSMLALTRKKDQALIINNNIEIKILDIKGDQIKLGVQAPKEVTVYRSEIYQQIQEANKEAMSEADAEAIKGLL